jgi:hypothetical protein
VSLAILDPWINGAPDPAQQLKRGVVTRLERPVGEANQVGEQDRQRLVAPTPSLRLGDDLPELKRPEAQLTNGARTPIAGSGKALPDQLRRLIPGNRQRIPVRMIPAGPEAPEQPSQPPPSHRTERQHRGPA